MFIAAGHMISEAYLWLMDHLFIINLVFSILIIFFQRRDPTTVWAWLLLLYFLPGLGIAVVSGAQGYDADAQAGDGIE